jgi:hypothetical protein
MSTAVERVLENGLANGEADVVDAIRELHERLAKVEGPTPVKATKATAAKATSAAAEESP